MGEEFFGSRTQRTRTLLHEKAMPVSEVFTYDRALEMIKHYRGGAVSMCYCRHTAHHRGTACDAPMEDICTSFGLAADFLVRRGFARRASKEEMVDILQKAEDLRLVHICDNVQDRNSFICHCCGCCCELLAGINELRIPHAVAPSSFIPEFNPELCDGCSTCVDACQVGALSLQGDLPVLDENFCLGCGICVSHCPKHAVSMTRRKDCTPIPRNWFGLMRKIAREKQRPVRW